MDLYSSSLGVGEVGLYLLQTDEEADYGQDQVDQAEEVGGQLHPPPLLWADCHLGPHSANKKGTGKCVTLYSLEESNGFNTMVKLKFGHIDKVRKTATQLMT